MTARRRMTIRALSGLAATLSLAMPAFAQNSDAPVDVTAAPPASSETVGPSQLQNFNLQGTVTRPAERPAPSSTAPSTASSAPPPNSITPAADQPIATRGDVARGNVVATSRSAAASHQPLSERVPSTLGEATPSLPLDVKTDSAPLASDAAGSTPAASPGDPSSLLFWPWLAALIALIGGGAFISWSRRSKHRRYADAGRMAFAGLVADTDVETAPLPPTRPRPDPVPPRAQPSPRPDPVPPSAPKPADDGLIKSTALKPELNFQFVPDRAVVTDQEVMLQFDVVLTNSGAAPARDVLVEAKMVPAHAGQDQEIAAFFQQPQATGDRMAGIPPLGKISLKSAVRLPIDQLHSFEVEGRKLFVPLVAFNILFRGGGGEGQASASFLVGRGTDGDEKLAPFRLDLGPRIFRGLSSRPHSMGLQR